MSSSSTPIELTVNMCLFSKARPRVTKNGVFMPAAYTSKRKEMVRQLKEQWESPPLEGPLRLELRIKGEGRADADNIIGALMDAANGLLWVDDRVSIIPEIEVQWEKAPKAESQWLISIYLLDCGQETLL